MKIQANGARWIAFAWLRLRTWVQSGSQGAEL